MSDKLSDPWGDVRELFPTFEGQSTTGSEIRSLLADADALLEAINEMGIYADPNTADKNLRSALAKIYRIGQDALAVMRRKHD